MSKQTRYCVKVKLGKDFPWLQVVHRAGIDGHLFMTMALLERMELEAEFPDYKYKVFLI